MKFDETYEHAGTASGTPQMLSLMGYCVVSDSGQIKQGIAMCERAIMNDPNNSEHYLNLGRIYILAGDKRRAIQVFKRGLKIRKDPRIVKELQQLGVRRTPPIGILPREHILNKVAGKMLHLLKMT
jgi:tetratricopeptide (TPR) repeat protein